ncbi:MAG: ComF family protein [Clostridia bacterium]
MAALVRDWLGALFYPQQNICHLCQCGLASAGEHTLCAACARSLTRERVPDMELAVPLHAPLIGCVCAYWYQGAARQLVHRLKFRSDSACAPPLAEGMCAAYALCSALRSHPPACLLPVPMHPRRERLRGYNQAALLAREVSAYTGLPIADGLLLRHKGNAPQEHRTREERLRAMSGAFSAELPPKLRGASFLLIDDVLTTGATATACAQALLSAGAGEVALLAACRA